MEEEEGWKKARLRDRSKQCIQQKTEPKTKKRCLLKRGGDYIDEINWITGQGTPHNIRAVDEAIEDQGLCSICWAYCGARGARCAFLAADRVVPPFSIQDTIDHSYPGLEGCRGGSPLAALQWMKREGVSEEGAYRVFTGLKEQPTPPRAAGEKHKVDTWRLVKDDEESIIAALREQPLIVSVNCYSGVVLLKGEGLVDLHIAEEYSERSKVPGYYDEQGGVTPHSLLLVGMGYFVPQNRRSPTIKYWIVKNQWGDQWGNNGLAYLIRNSSLDEIHCKPKKKKQRLSLESQATDDVGYVLTPVIPIVRREGQAEFEEPNNVITDQTPDQLLNMVNTRLTTTVFLIFYDPRYCQESEINVLEEVSALAKAYEFDVDVAVAMVDLNVHPNSYSLFNFGQETTLLFQVYKKQEINQTPENAEEINRTPENAAVFPDSSEYRFTFGHMLRWLGDDLAMGHSPILYYIN